MKKDRSGLRGPVRYGVAEAKAGLSSVLRVAEAGAPVLLHRRGTDVVVVLRVEEYERLVAAAKPGGVTALLSRLEEVKQRHGGGVDDFEVPRARLEAKGARFGGKRRGK